MMKNFSKIPLAAIKSFPAVKVDDGPLAAPKVHFDLEV